MTVEEVVKMDHMLAESTGLRNEFRSDLLHLDKNGIDLFPTSFANKGGLEGEDLSIR